MEDAGSSLKFWDGSIGSRCLVGFRRGFSGDV